MTHPAMTRRITLLSVLSAAALLPTMAFAHPGHGLQPSFMAGVSHPLTGIDHLAAMLALGLWAGTLQQRSARWSAPIAFVVMMLVGGMLGMQGVALPGVEVGIAASVLALGVLLLARVQVTAALAATVAGMFAVFHGHAHGSEAAGAQAISYMSGFALSTLSLHLLGMWSANHLRGTALRITGAALAIGGVALMAL